MSQDFDSHAAWRAIAWDTYFCGVVTMNRHPGMTRDGDKRLSIPECANVADQMLEERDKRFKRPIKAVA